MPGLNELRKSCTELLREGQAAGTVQPDIDPAAAANGIIALMLLVLMSVPQLGNETAVTYSRDVTPSSKRRSSPPPSRRPHPPLRRA
jgi:hypothetical protein